MSFLTPFQPQLLSALRIMSALLLLQHGTTKHLGFPPGPMNDVEAFSLGGIAGLFELVGGVLLAIGLWSRPVAFVLSGLMAAAYFIAHAPRGFWTVQDRGELARLLGIGAERARNVAAATLDRAYTNIGMLRA